MSKRIIKKTISISVVTLFPDFIQAYTNFGIIGRAIANRIVKVRSFNLRTFAPDRRGTVDDRPYGGGVGMVLRPDVMHKAIRKVRALYRSRKTRVVLLCPQGKVFNQKHAQRLSGYDHLVFVSGRYEGFDERIRSFVDEELSIGDYVLMGGELPALVVTEAVLRFIPGVLGKDESADNETFAEGLLEYPQYTKPELWTVKTESGVVKKMRVPKVLQTGHHANIAQWRNEQAIKRTKKRRPDLLIN